MTFKGKITTPIFDNFFSPSDSTVEFTKNQIIIPDHLKGKFQNGNLKNGVNYTLLSKEDVNPSYRYRIKLSNGDEFPLNIDTAEEAKLKKIHNINWSNKVVNHKYEILKALVDAGGQLTLESLMTKLTAEVSISEVSIEKRNYAIEMIGMGNPEYDYISATGFYFSTGLRNYIDNRNNAKYEPALPQSEKIVSITDKGRLNLKELHKPIPTTYQATFNAPFTGNFSQGDADSSQQIFNEPKKPEKQKWLTLRFYWEELIKHWYKLILVAIGVYLLSWLGFRTSKDKELNKQEQKQPLVQPDTTKKKDTLAQ